MFDVLPATRPDRHLALVPLAYAIGAHAALLVLLSLPALVAVAPLPPPPIQVNFLALTAAPQPEQATEGEGQGDPPRPRLVLPSPRPGSGAPRLEAPFQPETVGPLLPPDGATPASSGIPSAAADLRAAASRKRGARHGAEQGPRDGDLTGAEGGHGREMGSSAVLTVGGDVKAPEALTQVRPEYPALALLERTEGIVVLSAVIDADGSVIDVQALSGPALLREPAVTALRQWKFSPGTLNGKPVKVSFTLTVRFVLKEPEPTVPAGSGLDTARAGDSTEPALHAR